MPHSTDGEPAGTIMRGTKRKRKPSPSRPDYMINSPEKIEVEESANAPVPPVKVSHGEKIYSTTCTDIPEKPEVGNLAHTSFQAPEEKTIQSATAASTDPAQDGVKTQVETTREQANADTELCARLPLACVVNFLFSTTKCETRYGMGDVIGFAKHSLAHLDGLGFRYGAPFFCPFCQWSQTAHSNDPRACKANFEFGLLHCAEGMFTTGPHGHLMRWARWPNKEDEGYKYRLQMLEGMMSWQGVNIR